MPEGMYCTSQDTTFGSTAECVCANGFKRFGDGNSTFSIICNQHGQWSTLDKGEITCERKYLTIQWHCVLYGFFRRCIVLLSCFIFFYCRGIK